MCGVAQDTFADGFCKEFSRYRDDKKRKDPISDFMACMPLSSEREHMVCVSADLTVQQTLHNFELGFFCDWRPLGRTVEQPNGRTDGRTNEGSLGRLVGRSNVRTDGRSAEESDGRTLGLSGYRFADICSRATLQTFVAALTTRKAPTDPRHTMAKAR